MANTSATSKQPGRRLNPLTAGISGGITLMVVAALWLLFAPVNMGGKFAYFFVVGNSMEPHITANDLVLLRAADRYEVGDVIGFRDPDLGTVVHRIRAIEGDQYVTRGDNRDSDDPNRPFQKDVVGKEWHVLRGAASFVQTLQSPKSAVILTIASVALGLMSAKPQAASRRLRKSMAKRTPTWVGQVSYKSMNGDQIVTVASTMLFTAVALGAVMLWNGSERTVTRDIVLEQTGTLQYTANAGTGLYDEDRVTTGQPIFTQIGTQMPISFTYEVTPTSKDAAVGGVRGMVRVVVELSQDNAWKREFEIVPPTPFAGTTATAQGVIDIKQLQDTAARMEQAALLKYPVYTMSIYAEVKANGNITGRAQDFMFRADYPFQLQELQLIPGQKFAAEVDAPLNVKRDAVELWSTTIPVIGTRIGYQALQLITVVLGVFGALGMAFVYASTMLAARDGETALILSRYAPLLVSVQAADVDFGGRIVAVRRFEDLVRMARADGLFVVHAENGVADHFLLVTPEVTYLYSVPRPPEKFRFEGEDSPSPNEALAGLTRPDALRAPITASTADLDTRGTIVSRGSLPGPIPQSAAQSAAQPAAPPVSAPALSLPAARPLASPAPAHPQPGPGGPALAGPSPETPRRASGAGVVQPAAGPAPAPPMAPSAPAMTITSSTGTRPLPPMAPRPTDPDAPAAKPAGSGKIPPQQPPAAPPRGGKALV